MPVFNNQSDTVVAIMPCPVGSYGPDGLQCFNCTDGLSTQIAASTASSDCTAPPGFGWYDNGVGDDNPVTTADLQELQQNVVRCPPGSFKVSLNAAAVVKWLQRLTLCMQRYRSALLLLCNPAILHCSLCYNACKHVSFFPECSCVKTVAQKQPKQ
jgi:hypothetical protein